MISSSAVVIFSFLQLENKIKNFASIQKMDQGRSYMVARGGRGHRDNLPKLLLCVCVFFPLPFTYKYSIPDPLTPCNVLLSYELHISRIKIQSIRMQTLKESVISKAKWIL